MTDQRAAAYASTEALMATLVGHGVRRVVVSPGSRSTALTLTADAHPDLETVIVLDERSAGFVALGSSIVSDEPVALICSSGTATANYLPAVVEAARSRVRLVVLTADRPPGLLERDAPQTIDQVNLYGVHVSSSVSLPPAHEVDSEMVVQLVSAALSRSRPPDAGPVHINCPFTKPLEPPDDWTLSGRVVDTPPSTELREDDGGMIAQVVAGARHGVVVAGPRRTTAEERDAVLALGWPVLADPLSGFRGHDADQIVTGTELLLRDPAFVADHEPDAIVRIGGTPTGRATQAWLETVDASILIIDPDVRWTASGPEIVVRSNVADSLTGVSSEADPDWAAAWSSAETSVVDRRVVESETQSGSELSITRAVLDAEPALLWAASSMPIRHVDVMMGSGSPTMVFSNRGANGIDGTIASAIGAALGASGPVTALLGDLAFLHDVGSLTAAAELGVDLTIVVIDNEGGAIFSMLPIADRDEASFERLFTTPHQRDLVAIARGFGAESDRIDAAELPARLGAATGLTVLVVPADPVDTHAAYARMVKG